MNTRPDLLDCEDPLTTARRSADTRRYAVEQWNATHEEPIDAEQVTLFLADENYGDLTEEQKKIVRYCRDEINGEYREAMFRMVQFQDMRRRGMVRDLADFCRIYLPNSPIQMDVLTAYVQQLKERQEKGAALLSRRPGHNRPQCGRFRAGGEGLPKCPVLPPKGPTDFKAPQRKENQGVPTQVRRLFYGEGQSEVFPVSHA